LEKQNNPNNLLTGYFTPGNKGMFQTELNIILQSFSNDVLDFLFILITRLGDGPFIKLLGLVIIFGVNYRKGFMFLHLILWTSFLTSALKNYFGLPRPFYVDDNVRLIGKSMGNLKPLTNMGANSFMGLPPQDAIDFVRANRIGGYGFPSGHTSIAVAVWGGLALLFKRKWLTILGVVLIALIPLSRLYLGRHFLADIVGGYFLGGVLLFLFYRYVFCNEVLKNYLLSVFQKQEVNLIKCLLLIYFFIVPLLLPYLIKLHPKTCAMLLGLNIGFFLVWLRGLPDDSGSVANRITRVGVSIAVFVSVEYLVKLAVPQSFGVSVYIGRMVLMAAFVYGATEVNIRLGLLKR